MQNEVKITRSFSVPKAELFPYFIDKSLLEQWAHPNGMSLHLPVYEAKTGGRYIYEHTAKEGKFTAEGYFVEISPNYIVQVDQSIKGPDGQVLHENIECQIHFTEDGDSTELNVLTGGFKTQKDAHECKVGWDQCLDNLEAMIGKASERAAS